MANPFFILAKSGDLYHVLLVATDATTITPGVHRTRVDYPNGTDRREQPGWSLSGPAASLLYVALAGHAYGQPAHTASAYAARTARAILATRRQPGYHLAAKVVAHFGQKIWPGLGKLPVGPLRVQL